MRRLAIRSLLVSLAVAYSVVLLLGTISDDIQETSNTLDEGDTNVIDWTNPFTGSVVNFTKNSTEGSNLSFANNEFVLPLPFGLQGKRFKLATKLSDLEGAKRFKGVLSMTLSGSKKDLGTVTAAVDTSVSSFSLQWVEKAGDTLQLSDIVSADSPLYKKLSTFSIGKKFLAATLTNGRIDVSLTSATGTKGCVSGAIKVEGFDLDSGVCFFASKNNYGVSFTINSLEWQIPETTTVLTFKRPSVDQLPTSDPAIASLTLLDSVSKWNLPFGLQIKNFVFTVALSNIEGAKSFKGDVSAILCRESDSKELGKITFAIDTSKAEFQLSWEQIAERISLSDLVSGQFAKELEINDVGKTLLAVEMSKSKLTIAGSRQGVTACVTAVVYIGGVGISADLCGSTVRDGPKIAFALNAGTNAGKIVGSFDSLRLKNASFSFASFDPLKFPNIILPGGSKVTEGLVLAATMDLNNYKEGTMKTLGDFIGKEAELVISAELKSMTNIKLKATLQNANIKLGDRVRMTEVEVSLTIALGGPSVGLAVVLQAKLSKENDIETPFKAEVSVGLTKVAISGTMMSPGWDKPFGLKNVRIQTLKLSFAVNPSVGLFPTALEIGGYAQVTTGNKTPSFVLDASINLADPNQNYFFMALDNFDLSEIVEAFAESDLPKDVVAALNISMTVLRISLNPGAERTIPSKVVSKSTEAVKDIVVPTGFTFNSKDLNLWDIMRGTCKMEIVATGANKGIDGSLILKPLSLADGAIVISGTESDKADLQVKLKLIYGAADNGFLFDGQLNLFHGAIVGKSLVKISSKQFLIDCSLKTDLGYIAGKISADVNVGSKPSSFSLYAKVVPVDLQKIGEEISSWIRKVGAKAGAYLDKLRNELTGTLESKIQAVDAEIAEKLKIMNQKSNEAGQKWIKAKRVVHDFKEQIKGYDDTVTKLLDENKQRDCGVLDPINCAANVINTIKIVGITAFQIIVKAGLEVAIIVLSGLQMVDEAIVTLSNSVDYLLLLSQKAAYTVASAVANVALKAAAAVTKSATDIVAQAVRMVTSILVVNSLEFSAIVNGSKSQIKAETVGKFLGESFSLTVDIELPVLSIKEFFVKYAKEQIFGKSATEMTSSMADAKEKLAYAANVTLPPPTPAPPTQPPTPRPMPAVDPEPPVCISKPYRSVSFYVVASGKLKECTAKTTLDTGDYWGGQVCGAAKGGACNLVIQSESWTTQALKGQVSFNCPALSGPSAAFSVNFKVPFSGSNVIAIDNTQSNVNAVLTSTASDDDNKNPCYKIVANSI